MTVWGNSESLCHKAGEYYYELLRHNDAVVPEPIVRHVEGCSFCREQMRRLEDALAQAENEAKSTHIPENNQVIDALSRHFKFLDEHVHCSHVKPFLPELLISSRQIRIPTPITVHVENCPACSRELASIRELGLRDSQLNRLSLFYGQAGRHSPSQCRTARSAVAGLAAFSLDGADSQTLDHASLCPECRASLYRQRARTIPDGCVPDDQIGVLACREVSMADVFDFVVPFGLDAATIARTSGRRDAVATHLRACRQCMEKVQSLHQTLYAVAERADSPVWTVCRAEAEGENVGRRTPTDAHRYPLRVEVLRQEPAWEAVSGGKPRLHNKIALAVAVVLVGGALSIVIPLSTATGGMNVGGVRKAIGRRANVYLAKSKGEESAPYFEMWLAADRQAVVTKVGEERTLHEFGKRITTIYTPGSPPRTGPLSAEASDSCRKFMTLIFRDMIFAHASETDSFSETHDVASDRPGENWSVYELMRTNPGSGIASPLSRWRVFFDPVRNLPVKIEHLRQPSAKGGAVEVQVTRFTYLSQSAMDSEIKALFSAP